MRQGISSKLVNAAELPRNVIISISNMQTDGVQRCSMENDNHSVQRLNKEEPV